MTENKTLQANHSKRPLTQKGLPIRGLSINGLPFKRLSILATLLLLSACDSNSLTPNNENVNQTTNDSTAQTQNNNAQSGTANAPTNQIDTITEFPTHIKALSLLLHPLKPIKDANTNQGMLSSYKDKKGGYQPTFEEMTNLEYTAHISNIMFEQTDTGITQKLLPHNNFIIHNVFVPHTISHKMVKLKAIENANVETSLDNEAVAQIDSSNTPTAKLVKKEITTTFDNIIYQLSETPYAKDEDDKNLMQQHALYMSDISGQQMSKLHPDNEYLNKVEWKPSVSRYYFMTQSDSDNNGIIDEKDVYHNYVIDFKQDNPTAKKYDFSE